MLRVEPFRKHHIEEAAFLFTKAYRRLRLSIPMMPLCHDDPAAIAPLLCDLAACSAGAVALSGGKLVGYLLGMHIPEFKSPYPGVYCPEWAHAVAPGMEDVVYTALLKHIAPHWVNSGAGSFAITLLAENQPAVNAWYYNGFGLAVIDAVCPPNPIDVSAPTDLLIRRAASDDLSAVTSLLADHRRYMVTAPVSLVVDIDISAAQSVLNRINRAGHATWIAGMEGRAVGIIEVADHVYGASHIVSGGRGIGIKCVHVLPEWRGQGIASALLNTALTWASAQGAELCSVDFEVYNPSARRFWLRYFSPVCFSLVRRIDERAITAAQSDLSWPHRVRRTVPA